MGNAGSSSGRPHEDTVDYGYLSPQGVYTGQRDWNHSIVTQLIVDRKLAPFYRPLEDYSDDWNDDRILAARKDIPDSDTTNSDHPHPRQDTRDPPKPSPKRPSNLKDPSRCPEAALYRGAVECPICFLYYPPNINRSRCCDQVICTECFVQIKRTEPTATHLVSEPAACPYCVQDNFGIVYNPPSWRAGIGSDGMSPPSWADASRPSQQNATGSSAVHKRRRKSFSHDSPDVVTIDQIRPDWEAKLAAVRAAVTRRANRRIIMRQVGDRLIPVGVTSGRVHPLPGPDGIEGLDAETASSGGGSISGSRRRRGPRSNGQPDLGQLLGHMGLGGQDLEELMVMEAMRLSLLEHEAQQKREEERKRQEDTAEQGRTEAAPTEETSSALAADQSTSGTSSGAYSQSSQGDESLVGTSIRGRSLTPVSGQTAFSSPLGLAVDSLNDISDSIERSHAPNQSTYVTQSPVPVGNDDTRAGSTFANERSPLYSGTATTGRSQAAEHPAGATMQHCVPLSSSLSDADILEQQPLLFISSSSMDSLVHSAPSSASVESTH